MKPTCQDFVFARDGGMGRSPTEEAIIDYVDRSEEVATPSPAMERETDSMWFYAEASDAEDWNGPHDTEVDAIAEARADYAGERDDFWVDEALPVDWQKVFGSFADADRVLEDLADYIGDNEHVEDPEPEFATSKAEAQAALEAWFAAHVEMRPYYQCVGKPKGYLVSDPQPASPDAQPLEAPLSADDLARIDAARDRVMAFAKSHDDPGVIRAAEGKTLEPGQYEVVEIAAIDTSPQFETGEILRVSREARAVECRDIDNIDRQWAWPIGSNAPLTTWVTVVRRVQEQAPRAEAATGDLYVPKRREQCRVVAVHPIDAQRVSIGDVLTCCYEADSKSGGATGSFAGYVLVYDVKKIIGVWCRVEPVTDPIAPATPRSESASHAHWVQVADTRLGQIRGLNKQLDGTRNELHRASIGRSEALAKAAEQSSRITHLEASLETARFELSNGIEVMNARQAHDRARIAELKTELSQVARDEDGRFVRQAAWNAACCFEESANKRMATDKEKLYELDAQLSTRTAELEAAPQWIRARGSLPDSDTWVLAVSREADYVVVQLEFTDDSEGHGEPYWSAEGGDLALCNYPHWMPLPSPPAESPEPAPGVEAPEVKP